MQPELPVTEPHLKPRRSRCASLSLLQEQERLRRLSVAERIRAALSMQSRFSWLKPAPGDRKA